ELMTRGAVKYGRNNWQLANGEEELERFKDSALRHMYQWLEGDESEDHAAAVFFNIAGAEYVLQRMTKTSKPIKNNI
ncbi:MAG: dATP/dGTP diphosphohydrolase domain-containing protein, partial [Candidatus Paceibacterota bacterium]